MPQYASAQSSSRSEAVRNSVAAWVYVMLWSRATPLRKKVAASGVQETATFLRAGVVGDRLEHRFGHFPRLDLHLDPRL